MSAPRLAYTPGPRFGMSLIKLRHGDAEVTLATKQPRRRAMAKILIEGCEYKITASALSVMA